MKPHDTANAMGPKCQDERATERLNLGLADPTLTDDQLYEAIAKHPILLQRPIVVRNGRAIIGRPPENIEALFA